VEKTAALPSNGLGSLRLCAFAGNFNLPIELLPENFFD
jgi:hypothetical protein